jgi:hypothetical protein
MMRFRRRSSCKPHTATNALLTAIRAGREDGGLGRDAELKGLN